MPGGAGFVGSALVRAALRHGLRPVAFDALTYAADPRNIEGVCELVHADVCDADAVARAVERADAVINVAAETHVDRAIGAVGDNGAHPFLATNVVGTQNLIDACRRRGVPLVAVSTDEVYGPLPDGINASEDAPLRPRNAYAASKAAADMLALAACATFGVNAVVTRSVNNYGPRQHPEKLIPRLITRAIRGRRLPIFGDGRHSRGWIHVDDHAEALIHVLHNGEAGTVYNISAGVERHNLQVAREVLSVLGRPADLVEHVADRAGHDRRYGIANARLTALGWTPRAVSFELGLADTVRWYEENETWWTAKAS